EPADEKSKSPNEQIRFACIGVGGKGDSDSRDAARHGEIVALCDVDDNTLGKASERYPRAKKYNDFRKMFDDMGKSIDAVTGSTRTYNHAAIPARGRGLGKHSSTQKPLTHTIYEARRLGEIARERKVATQMGNQGPASSGLRKAAAIIRAGALGA